MSAATSEASLRRADSLLGEFGLESWRPGQREAVAAALEGRDSLIVMPTGGGKSLCYQLPGIATEDLTIVVSPLIALIQDQWQRLTEAGHPVAMIVSGMEEAETRRALAHVRGDARIVYCSPERFGSRVFLEAIGQRRIDLLAVDEAHCVSEWGHDFRPDYLRLPEIATRLGRPTVMACTATATKAVAAEVASRFEMRDPLQVRSGFDRTNLSFDVIAMEGKGSKAKRQALLERGLSDPANLPAIVYCGTRKETEAVGKDLGYAGLQTEIYHGGMEPQRRSDAQAAFMYGNADVIVATNAFGMGVDKADVRSVWHMTIPTSLEAYYQEAGRAGRDGELARAVLLALRLDLGRLVRFNEQRRGNPELAIALERGWRDFRVIKSFIYSEKCRRRAILDHFGDRAAGAPLGRCCDLCDPEDDLLQMGDRAAAPRPRRREASGEGRREGSGGEDRRRGRGESDRSQEGGGAGDYVEWGGSEAEDWSSGEETGGGEDEELFEALKAWRLTAADGRPAYTVASNRTLEEIVARRPRSSAELLRIKGVGPSFISKYADEVLELVDRGGR